MITKQDNRLSHQPTSWEIAAARLKTRLGQQQCKLRVDITDLDTFQAALNDLCKQYAQKNVLRLVRKYIEPHFEHIQSFQKAICMNTTPNADVASLVWAIAQAIIEVRHSLGSIDRSIF
jgi:hypothetical protein